ncbi:MAG: phage tail protein [Allosphingosinicella sp.]
MSSPFVAEVRILGFNFPPTGWAFCDGQLMPISQNTALFSLLGTFYGGDGKSTFALPDLQDSCTLGQGQGAGSQYFVGQQSGEQFVTLLTSEIPAHTHNMTANISPATLGTGDATTVFARASGGNAYKSGAANVALDPQSISVAGASLPHNNMMPYLTLNFCIALQGVFPARN